MFTLSSGIHYVRARVVPVNTPPFLYVLLIVSKDTNFLSNGCSVHMLISVFTSTIKRNITVCNTKISTLSELRAWVFKYYKCIYLFITFIGSECSRR